MWQLGSPNYGDQTISETESQACHYKDPQIFLKSSRVPGTVICLINMTALLYICICTNEWIIWISGGKSINQMQVVFPESGCLPLFAPLPLPLSLLYFTCLLRQPLSSAQAGQIGHWFQWNDHELWLHSPVLAAFLSPSRTVPPPALLLIFPARGELLFRKRCVLQDPPAGGSGPTPNSSSLAPALP